MFRVSNTIGVLLQPVSNTVQKKFGRVIISLLPLRLTKWLNCMVKMEKDESAQQKILQAARKVFTMQGMAGARMQDIADEAGINKALLHYYFRSKEQLFEVIFNEEAEKFFPRINFIFNSDLPLQQKIEEFADAYMTEMIENPYLPWFVVNEMNRDPENFIHRIWKAGKPKPAKFLAQVEEEIRKGTIRRIHPVHLLMNLLSMCIFPFLGRPMFQRNLGLSDKEFMAIMETRKKEVPAFIIASLAK